MSKMGADTEQLSALGGKLKSQQEVIDGVISTVSSALGNTIWEGPARQRFEGDWHNSFLPVLRNLNQAFQGAGTECQQRSAALAAAMGVG
ncbi:MAG: hypothetical protein H0U21_16850 [Acidimicrobiia bacterium]|nr:hypothetical protein [Acidimicrobiia bacterium]